MALFLLIGLTGTISLMLQAVGPEVPWVIPVQNLLLLIMIFGSAGVIINRIDSLQRRTLLIFIGPLLIGLALAVFLPQAALWFLGAGVGWLFVAQLLIRRNVRREYQDAIRHLRKSEYDQAIDILNKLVQAEPEDTGHLRFRGDLHRLKGAFNRAIRDYRRITELEPQSSLGYNGLAEIYLQQQQYSEALEFARQAYRLEPDQWVIPYNLGMIEDRLSLWADSAEHLQEALNAGVPDSRHRLLIHLWMARAAARMDHPEEAELHLEKLRKEKRGLQEWQTVFQSDQAQTLRAVLAADVALAQQITQGAGPEALADRRSDEEA